MKKVENMSEQQRPLQQRTRQRRNVVQTSRGTGPKDDRTLKSTAGVNLTRPAYSGSRPLVIRILPNMNPDVPGDFDLTRLSSDPGDFSEWAVSAPAARYIGMDQKFTFLLYDPLNEDYDARENPYEVFHSAIRSAVRVGEARIGNRNVMSSKWASYMPLGANQCIDKPKFVTFYQALVYQNYNDVYVKGGDLPLGARDNMINVVQISTHAHKKLIDLLEQEKPNYEGDPNDWRNRYTYGDIVDFNAGKFVVIYNPKSQSLSELTGEVTQTIMDDDSSNDSGRDSSEERGYSVAILDKFCYVNNGRRYSKKAELSSLEYFDRVKQNVRWWDDILHFPSHEEICRMMAVAYRSDPDLLRYGWRTHSEFFTDEVEGILNARTTVPMSSKSRQEPPADRRRSAAMSAPVDDVIYDDDEVILDGDEDSAF